MKILVCGAFGNVSRTLLQKLADLDVTDMKIIACVSENTKTPLTSEYSGVEFRVINYDQEHVVLHTLLDIDVLLIVPSSSKKRVQNVQTLVKCACNVASMQFVLLLSLIGCEHESDLWSLQYHAMEDAL